MAPVSTQDDKRESVAIFSAIKRSLHIGKGIRRWLVLATLRVCIGRPDMTDNNTQANCQRDNASQTRIQVWHGCSLPFTDRRLQRLWSWR